MTQNGAAEDMLAFHEDIKVLRYVIEETGNYIYSAEREVPEKMLRFVMYMNGIHNVASMCTSQGHIVPPYILKEMERCDDRFRQLLNELHSGDREFDKVRQVMASDTDNRWDHTCCQGLQGGDNK